MFYYGTILYFVFHLTQIVPYTRILYCLLFLCFASVIVSVGDPTMRNAFFVWI